MTPSDSGPGEAIMVCVRLLDFLFVNIGYMMTDCLFKPAVFVGGRVYITIYLSFSLHENPAGCKDVALFP